MNTNKPFIPTKPLNQIQQSNETRIKWQNELIAREVWQCCLNCSEWSKGDGTPMMDTGEILPQGCRLYKSMPPVEILVVGCKDHMCDIPF